MAYVIKIDSVTGTITDIDGEILERTYVESYDPDSFDGRGDVKGTTDIKKAKKFDTAGAAMEFYMQASKVRPLRDDGRPNRPLTAFTVSIELA